MRAAGLVTYYKFDFRNVKKQDRYGLVSSFPTLCQIRFSLRCSIPVVFKPCWWN